MQNLNQDICPLVKDLFTDCSTEFLSTMKYGFKAVVVRFFELIRYLGIQYFEGEKVDFINTKEFKDISKC
jgi:hypothetical protein